MLTNYLKIAFRRLRKQKGYVFINVAGLAVAMACGIFIFLFVRDELSYDEFHENADRIYRMVSVVERGDQVHKGLLAPTPLGPALKRDFPEVDEMVRMFGGHREHLVTRSNESVYENGFLYADSTFFQVFSFSLVRGNTQTALDKPFSVVITEEMAAKYFGTEDPIGKTLTIEGPWDSSEEYEVTGVAADPPHNSHFQFNFIAPLGTLRHLHPRPEHLSSWRRMYYYTYVLLGPNTEPQQLEAKFPSSTSNYYNSSPELTRTFELQPITDIHLYSHYDRELAANSDPRYIYIFSVIALLILGIACINYMNLATARSADRAPEVGVRKASGASQGQLTWQFLSESILLSLAALVVGLILAALTQPLFNQLTGRPLGLDFGSDWPVLLGFVAVSGVVGLLAGSYPAFFLSRFQPVRVLKDQFTSGSSNALLRKGLVTFQFAVSVGLIVGTMVVYQQLDYMQSKRLGINQEHVVQISTHGEMVKSYPAFKQELLKQSNIQEVTAASTSLPASENISHALIPEGVNREEWANRDTDVNSLSVDPDFPQVMDISVLRGTDLAEPPRTKERMPVLVNETAVRQFGRNDPIGKRFTCCRKPTPEVVGVVQDFHYQALRDKIEPLVLMKWAPPYYAPGHVLARISSDNISAALASIRETWSRFTSGKPFTYTFMDRQFENVYQSEARLARIFGAFAIIAIVIACLGLFGLATFTAERRTKEIGIRKVLGATVSSIVALLSKDFLKLVVVAIIVATPIAYYTMNQWLQDFAYRIEIGLGIFLLAGMCAIAIALLTVSYQSVNAALTNPAESLRYE